MTSARTSLGEVRTRRRSRRAAGPSASARRAASSQNTGARAYQRPGRQVSCRTNSSPASAAELRELVEEQDAVMHECSRMYLEEPASANPILAVWDSWSPIHP